MITHETILELRNSLELLEIPANRIKLTLTHEELYCIMQKMDLGACSRGAFNNEIFGIKIKVGE